MDAGELLCAQIHSNGGHEQVLPYELPVTYKRKKEKINNLFLMIIILLLNFNPNEWSNYN